MLNKTDYILIGKLVKSHGVKGEAVLRMIHYNFEDIIKMESVFLEYEGLLVPFFLEYYIEKQQNEVICKFEDIDKQEKMKDFINSNLFIPKDDIKHNDTLIPDIYKLIGYTVIDNSSGEIGRIEEIIEIENNPQIKIKGKEKQILIPINSDFVKKIDKKNHFLYITTPEGFLDIF